MDVQNPLPRNASSRNTVIQRTRKKAVMVGETKGLHCLGRRYKVPDHGNRHQGRKWYQYNFLQSFPVFFFGYSGDIFAQVKQYGLWAEPAAPDSSKDNGNKADEEEEKERNAKNEIKLPYPDNRSENIEFECWNVKA
jgi:hypothetical protein